MAGLFLSSILGTADGRGEVDGDVATGIRQRVKRGDGSQKLSARGLSERELGSCYAREPRLVLQLSPRGLSSSKFREELPLGEEFGDGGKVIVARS